MKYLDFYKKCMKTGKLPENGLCNCINMKEEVTPVDPEIRAGYWAGSNYNLNPNVCRYDFNPLRQNLVLFMACMNGEL